MTCGSGGGVFECYVDCGLWFVVWFVVCGIYFITAERTNYWWQTVYFFFFFRKNNEVFVNFYTFAFDPGQIEGNSQIPVHF